MIWDIFMTVAFIFVVAFIAVMAVPILWTFGCLMALMFEIIAFPYFYFFPREKEPHDGATT